MLLMQILKKITFILSLLVTLGLTACVSTQNNESAGQYVDSSAITTKVKAQLVNDLGISSVTAIKVKTYKGVVQLSGFVDNNDQINQAIASTRSIAGVRAVQNSLLVKNRVTR
jgi:osmotically-inducible protein OsmY